MVDIAHGERLARTQIRAEQDTRRLPADNAGTGEADPQELPNPAAHTVGRHEIARPHDSPVRQRCRDAVGVLLERLERHAELDVAGLVISTLSRRFCAQVPRIRAGV